MAEQKYPEVAVGALIFNPDGKIFLMKSHKWHNKYVMPGGHIELGETIEAALKREIREETGLDIYDIEFLLVQENIFSDEFWRKGHCIYLDFACKTKSAKVKLNSEAQEFVWVGLKEALKLDVEPYTLPTIKEYARKKGIKI